MHWTRHGNDSRTDQLATAFKQARNEAVNFQNVNGHSTFTARQVAGALRAIKLSVHVGLTTGLPQQLVESSDRGEGRDRLHFECV